MKFVQFTKLYDRYANDGSRIHETRFYRLNIEDDEYEYCVQDDDGNDDYYTESTVSFFDEEYPEDVIYVRKDNCEYEVIELNIIKEN